LRLPAKERMMSLSKDFIENKGVTAVAGFEMGSFELTSLPKQEGDSGFVALQIDAGSGSAFVPFGGGGDDHHSQNSMDKIESIEQEAYEKGFARGEKNGLELGDTKALKIIENIENLLTEVSQLKAEMIKQHEKEIVQMVFAIAGKVIHTQVNFDEKAVRGSILNALALTAEKNNITLKINPEDFDCVEKLRPEFFSEFKDLKSIMITADPSISRGGCLLETPNGDIDASIETQLEMIHKCLQEAYTG